MFGVMVLRGLKITKREESDKVNQTNTNKKITCISPKRIIKNREENEGV